MRPWNVCRVCVHFSNCVASRVLAHFLKIFAYSWFRVIAHRVCIFISRFFRVPSSFGPFLTGGQRLNINYSVLLYYSISCSFRKTWPYLWALLEGGGVAEPPPPHLWPIYAGGCFLAVWGWVDISMNVKQGKWNMIKNTSLTHRTHRGQDHVFSPCPPPLISMLLFNILSTSFYLSI